MADVPKGEEPVLDEPLKPIQDGVDLVDKIIIYPGPEITDVAQLKQLINQEILDKLARDAAKPLEERSAPDAIEINFTKTKV
jgi:hypothetical protein